MIYDRNRISIEGDTDIAFTEDVAARYEAYGWHVQTVDWTNGGKEYVEDVPALYAAIRKAHAVDDKPSLIVLDTVIAWPAPNAQGTEAAHGSALGAEEVAATKKVLGFDPEQTFEVPPGVLERTRELRERGAAWGAEWDEQYAAWAEAHPESAELLHRLKRRELPADLRRRAADLRGRREGRGHAVRVRQGHQRPRSGAARAVGRLGRPRRLQQHHDHQRPLRRPRGRARSASGAPTRTPAGCCTSASASTAWARS